MDVMSTPVRDLIDVLHQEIDHLHHLAEVATEERTALQRMAMPAFDTVNQRRVQTLELIQVLEARREALLNGLAREWGMPPGSVTLSTLIERVSRDVGRTLEGQQREMERAVDVVRQLMAVNRLAMGKLVDFIQQTMAAAHPVSGADALYSGSGTKKLTRASGRMVAQKG